TRGAGGSICICCTSTSRPQARSSAITRLDKRGRSSRSASTSCSDGPMAFRVKHTRLALWAALITWLPLPVLIVLETGSLRGLAARSFLTAAGPHARYLVCVPLLIIADAVCPPRLWRVIEHFGSSGIIADDAALERLTAAGHRWFESKAAGVAVILLAYVATGFIM